MPSHPQPAPRTATIASYLSEPRLGPYLSASGGNVKDALRLYQWNIDVSGSAYEALHIFEVVLRNAIDEQLRSWNATQVDSRTGHRHTDDWLLDPARLLVRLVGDDIDQAATRARRTLRSNGRPDAHPEHPDILAQLNFGTWRFLLPDKDRGRRLLWDQALHHAFPHLTETRAALVRKVHGIYQLRNRVAHLEPLLKSGLVRKEYEAMRSVLAAIDDAVDQWFTSRQRMTTILKSRPR